MTYKTTLLNLLSTLRRTFAPDELAYLALTSKVEFVVRDKLAFGLHRRLHPSRAVVAREWRRTDLAVLTQGVPVLLLELKAMYTLDGISSVAMRRFTGLVRHDIRKARRFAGPTTELYALLLVTHSEGTLEPRVEGVVKYRARINAALDRLGTPAAVRRVSSRNTDVSLRALGPLTRGSIKAGRAFGVPVLIDYWLIGPVARGGLTGA